MKNILLNEKAFDFQENNLPLLINGKEGSGASFFSILTVCNLLKHDHKVLFFSAFDMAKNETAEQLKADGYTGQIFFLNKPDQIKQALDYELIIVDSGNIALFKKIISNLNDTSERIIFIKNIESLLPDEILPKISKNKKIILSGDIDLSPISTKVLEKNYATIISFSKTNLLDINCSNLGQYEAMATGSITGKMKLSN